MSLVDSEEGAGNTVGSARALWASLILILPGAMLVGLDRTIATAALPRIGVELGGGGLEWVLTGYFIAVGVIQPGTGWLADEFGAKAIYIGALFLFVLGSAAAGLAPSLSLLVVGRVIQGLAGGALIPVSLAMVYDIVPEQQRGRAFGLWGLASMVSPALGPLIGGYLASAATWRWAFLINVPIGGITLAYAVRALPDRLRGAHRRLDWTGWGLVAVGLPMMLIGVSEVGSSRSQAAALTALGLGTLLVTAFVVHQLSTAEPLLSLRLFALRSFTVSIALQWLVSAVYTAELVFIPLDLTSTRNLTVFGAGLVLTASALGAMATMHVGGRLVDVVGTRAPVTVGVIFLGVAAALLGVLGQEAPMAVIVGVMTLQGMGGGLALMPLTVATLDAVPPTLVTQASALRALNKQLAQALGVAVLAALLARQLGDADIARSAVGTSGVEAAYHSIFLAMVPAMAIALPLCLLLPHRLDRGPKEDTKECIADRGTIGIDTGSAALPKA